MYDKRRPFKHLYNTALWKKLRLSQLAQSPVCVYCEKQGRVEVATVVDHIKPHKGDEILFYSPSNLQSLCKPHHDSTKALEESRGVVVGSSLDGSPLDPNHHWN